MWNLIIDFGKKSADFLRKLQRHEDAISKLQQSAREQEQNTALTNKTLTQLLYEFDRDRQQAAHDKEIAERDREILILKLDAALCEGSSLKISGGAAPPSGQPDLAEEMGALRREVEELKKRVAALENL